MSATALTGWEMPTDGDPMPWTSIVGALGGLGTIGAFFLGLASRARDRANAEGMSAGEVRAWRVGVEANQSAMRAEIQALESRFEIHKDKIAERMEGVATRVEMDARFDKLERQLEGLLNIVRPARTN